MNQKENWIQETLNSFDNINSAEVSPDLAERLLNTTYAKGKVIYMQPIVKWVAAACIVLLAGINVASIIHYDKRTTSGQTENNPVYKEYFTYLNTL